MSTPPHRVLSVIPPMTQLNTPYPSTAYLTGFLRSRGVDAVQEDLALALVLKLLSRRRPAARARGASHALPAPRRTRAASSAFIDALRALPRHHRARRIAFLQGRDPTLAHRIASRAFLPEGPRFAALDVYVDDRRRRPAGLGLRRAGHAGPRAPPGHAVPERPRRRAARRGRPALRVRALRRALAQSQPSFEPLAAGAGRAAEPGRPHAARR